MTTDSQKTELKTTGSQTMGWRWWGGIAVRTLLPLAVAVGSAAFFYYQRGWVLRLAVWTGLAMGLLLYVLFERVRILRRLYQRK